MIFSNPLISSKKVLLTILHSYCKTFLLNQLLSTFVLIVFNLSGFYVLTKSGYSRQRSNKSTILNIDKTVENEWKSRIINLKFKIEIYICAWRGLLLTWIPCFNNLPTWRKHSRLSLIKLKFFKIFRELSIKRPVERNGFD